MQVSWKQRKTNDSILSEVNESRKSLSTICVGRWTEIRFMICQRTYTYHNGRENKWKKRRREQPRT